jgi:hypothetical protein
MSKSNKVTYKFGIDGEKWIFFYTEENRELQRPISSSYTNDN